LLIAACWLGLAYLLSIEQSKSLAGATQQVSNLARLFKENTLRTFEGIDRGLLLMREAYERDPAHFDLHEWSKQATLLGDPTFELTVIGADGFAVVTTISGGDNVFERFYVGDRERALSSRCCRSPRQAGRRSRNKPQLTRSNFHASTHGVMKSPKRAGPNNPTQNSARGAPPYRR
jgi:hypothetical protein